MQKITPDPGLCRVDTWLRACTPPLSKPLRPSSNPTSSAWLCNHAGSFLLSAHHGTALNNSKRLPAALQRAELPSHCWESCKDEQAHAYVPWDRTLSTSCMTPLARVSLNLDTQHHCANRAQLCSIQRAAGDMQNLYACRRALSHESCILMMIVVEHDFRGYQPKSRLAPALRSANLTNSTHSSGHSLDTDAPVTPER